MVFGIFGDDKKQEKSLQDIENELSDLDSSIKTERGKQQLEALKKKRKKQLRSKQAELKKEKFKQTKAGKVLDSIGKGLDSIADDTEDPDTRNQLTAFSNGIESLDGDGKNDSRNSIGIGLKDPSKNRPIELDGDVTIEGDIIEKGEQRRKNRDKGNGFGSLSKNMEDIIG